MYKIEKMDQARQIQPSAKEKSQGSINNFLVFWMRMIKKLSRFQTKLNYWHLLIYFTKVISW